jgi:hypothetical protein
MASVIEWMIESANSLTTIIRYSTADVPSPPAQQMAIQPELLVVSPSIISTLTITNDGSLGFAEANVTCVDVLNVDVKNISQYRSGGEYSLFFKDPLSPWR